MDDKATQELGVDLSLFKRVKSRQMLLLIALAGSRSLREAAAQLEMTQPGATKLLQDLELTIGHRLFERGPRGMQPNDYGEAMIRHARLIFADLSRTRLEISAMSSGATGRIRIGAVISVIPFLLARAVARLKKQFPRLFVSIEVGTSDGLVPLLTSGELDVLVARPLVLADRPEFKYEELINEPLQIVSRKGHPLARRRTLALRDLAGQAWALLPTRTPMRKVLEPVFADIGPGEPHNLVETSSVMTMIALMQESDMLAVMPEDIARFSVRSGLLRKLSIDLPPIMGAYGIVTRRDRIESPGTAAFLQHLRATKNAAT
ncbi:LysR family transcriptional regulator [Xanthobacteraceae bacterium Astr-EGSB]|uniref:LysR family transcriptional regulator n=1 Tax=Astrobacterium formosum TaxID=3069710 RepID=UPI0027B34038|nr:LysR family transcriptional regulator [Xanthobacteraceae bacterium Astr-EGSB]